MPLFGANGALDARPKQLAAPGGVHSARSARDLIPRGQLLRACRAALCVLRCDLHGEGVAFEEKIVESLASDVHELFFHCSCSCFLVAKRIHFEFPSLMFRICPISAWLKPSTSKSMNTVRRCSGSSASIFRSVIRFASSMLWPARAAVMKSSIGAS